jgi:hypothetical protein
MILSTSLSWVDDLFGPPPGVNLVWPEPYLIRP